LPKSAPVIDGFLDGLPCLALPCLSLALALSLHRIALPYFLTEKLYQKVIK
jgi:hypothetical protein